MMITIFHDSLPPDLSQTTVHDDDSTDGSMEGVEEMATIYSPD